MDGYGCLPAEKIVRFGGEQSVSASEWIISSILTQIEDFYSKMIIEDFYSAY
jgi:hypothetical protein